MSFPVYIEKMNVDSRFYQEKMDNLRTAEAAYSNNSLESSLYPVKINAQITDACNLNCIICPIKRPLKNPHVMDIEVFENIAHAVFPYSILFSPTDIGEPLIYPWFDKICNLLKEYDVLLDLTTNGTLLNRDISEKILSVAADIKISFDGFNNVTFEGIRCGAKKGLVERKLLELSSIRQEIAYPQYPEITVQSTILRRNISEIPDIVNLAYSAGADRVKAYYLISYRSETDDEVLAGEDEEYRSYLSEAHDLAKSYSMQIELAEYSTHIRDLDLKRVNCKNPWYQTWIDYNGDLYPCHSHRGFSCGNIGKGFSSVWNGHYYRQLRRSIINNKSGSICHNCGMQYSQSNDQSFAPYDRKNFFSNNASNPKIDDQIRWSARTRLFDLNRRDNLVLQ
ncbi:radical SAM protein [Methanolacinia paynteri]|uniref:radical SAM protein n=1 Tax=Methanolacinia paynteri TaxID=230356 RepID=UPI00065000BC|nr:radical SAM protein [Methanolacinia paynteri]